MFNYLNTRFLLIELISKTEQNEKLIYEADYEETVSRLV